MSLGLLHGAFFIGIRLVKEQSLHQIMNDMVKRLDTLRPVDSKKHEPKPLSELEAFIRIDDLLASLNKQYLEAKAQRQELVAVHGAQDAMTEIAFDMEDSAWCAMQTRYLELRVQRELMERAQRMMRQAEEMVEYHAEREAEKEKEKTIDFVKMLARLRFENRAKPYLYFVLLLFADNNFFMRRHDLIKIQ